MTDVKLPEGTSIEEPAKEKKAPGMVIPKFNVAVDLPLIVYPHFTNNNRSELACILLPPGPAGPGTGQPVHERGIPADPKHPLFKDIMAQFTEEEITHNTNREVKLQEANRKAYEDAASEAKNIKIREDLWNLKQEFLAMDIVKKDENKMWRRRIRRATTPIQAQAYGIACLIRDAEDSE
jgi:hypothetical protein